MYERPSRYQPVIDRGAHLGYRERERGTDRQRNFERDEYAEAGPSKPRRSASVINDYPARPSSSMSTRFPKPARKMQSTIELRETVIIHHRPQDTERVARGGTVKKKKPRVRELDERSEVSSSPGMPIGSGSASELRRMKKSVMADDDSSLASGPSASLPPSLRMKGKDSETSSARSSPAPPMSPIVPEAANNLPRTMGKSNRRPSASVIQKAVVTSNIAPLTPPESESSLHHIDEAVAQMNLAPKPRLVSPPDSSLRTLSPRLPKSSRGAGSDSEEETFYTPRQSLEPPPRVVAPEIRVEQPAGEQSLRPPAPMLSLQPPTPAAQEDMKHSPLDEADSPSREIIAAPVSLAPAIDSPSLEEADETHSLHAAVGSDESEDEDEQPTSRPVSQRGHCQSQASGSRSQPHSRQASFSMAARPASRTGSMVVLPAHRAPSSGGSMGPPPIPIKARTMGSPSSVGQSSARSSKRASNTVFGDFKVLRRASGAASERSFGASDVTPNSGYGKGGWAAAHGTRSNAPSPVMYMPQGANDGWGEFQMPPRSKFTPLPQASQGPTFENMLHDEQHLGVDEEYSSPSEYSKLSDGEPLPQPSRSYTKASQSSNSQDYASEDGGGPSRIYESPIASRSSSDEQYHPYRDRSDTIRGPTQPRPTRGQDSRPPSAMERYSRSSSSGNASGGRINHNRSPSYPSRSTSPSPLSRPVSPPPPRPESSMSMMSSTPRGFDAPSFLNPDTLTFLPEMTVEDSGRTYVPDPTGDAQRKADAIRRTRNSIYSKSIKSARSVKSAGSDEEEEQGTRRAPRSKSSIGFRRPPSQRWEGSTAGEGVLLESNGLDQGHNGGYTNLILPTGAYQPQSPGKAATEVNARVLGLPHAAMAALVLSTATHRLRSDTPAHLRSQLPAPVDFSSHLKPPTKVSDNQVLVQVYAVAIDGFDLAVLDVKSRADVGKWVPGRSFVGRCLQVGSYEKELVRGDLIMGLCDVRKVSLYLIPSGSELTGMQSGALAEYITCDRRRLARTPFPTQLTLEQMSLLPLQGLPSIRALRGRLGRQYRALVCDPHRGVTALMCQELSRSGTHVTALISGGDDHHSAQSFCMLHGAKGVLTGRPASVMNQLEENAFDLVIDTQGGQNAYDAAKRILKDGGK